MHNKPAQQTTTLRRLALLSILLAIVVIGLGAYTRLTHAGLGCPDWPTCYGLIDVPETAAQIAKAEQAFPHRPVEPQKAWNEMIHRYFAGSLGLFILSIAIISLKTKQANQPLKLPLSLLALVIFQGALGMWTVTLKLMPLVVMAHLLGGFTTLCLLFLLYLRLGRKTQSISRTASKPVSLRAVYLGLVGIIILTIQIALGGWTSANYAAMSCIELPLCQGNWTQNLNFSEAFELIPPQKETYEFGHLPHEARVTIHISHRIGALITTLYLAWLGLMVLTQRLTTETTRYASLLLLLLGIQIALGISNIWFSLPLAVAVSHNVVAACLMLSLIALTYQLQQTHVSQANQYHLE